jgi:hypothetical protein
VERCPFWQFVAWALSIDVIVARLLAFSLRRCACTVVEPGHNRCGNQQQRMQLSICSDGGLLLATWFVCSSFLAKSVGCSSFLLLFFTYFFFALENLTRRPSLADALHPGSENSQFRISYLTSRVLVEFTHYLSNFHEEYSCGCFESFAPHFPRLTIGYFHRRRLQGR